ncbi:exopolysaccharide biosynthesis polyprenyl glycosylphosphotransferase [Sphingomonas populi]|uniref:Exopolysaccharide biosynthesis polyprenyl glycosylphosphotransferase n=1 Tax=Sphingomonas populi TaxID=2484750 RepID=A0A4Q6Y4Z9_9SPHN|nr:exopolysaccharide biosynthesis polyprenyl glycosylphosphotransferase [Sphingomonas populi]RZF64246.1 exopolysaccharide biosynthesis polyprenyl glycosylphosphotransferase [Sphingomonas populi]
MNLELGRSGWAQEPGSRDSMTSVSTPSWRPRASALRSRAFIGLMLVDLLCIIASFLAAVLLHARFGSDKNWIVLLAVLLPMYVVIALNAHAYSSPNLQDPFRAVAKGAQALVIAISAVIFVAFFVRVSDGFPRMLVTLGSIFSLGSLIAARYLFVKHMAAIIGGNPFSVILICEGDQRVPPGKFSVVISPESFFDPEQHDPVMYDRLAKSLESADRVVVACSPERRTAWAHALKGANIQSEIVAPELRDLAPLGMGNHGSEPTIVIANGPLGLFDRFMKRAFDFTLALGALLALLPILAVIAVLVKLDSAGPVFFKQTRIGRGNQMFKMLKFRSMRVLESDLAGARSASRDDDRVTRVGKFIRRTSMDELPQLINVLKGDMSIVGPRPHALGSRAADKLFWEVDTRYWHRHAAKPGLTGLAQVRGYRGATVYESDLRNRLQADLEYLDTWSIWRDLLIIAMTFRVLLHRNAF